MQSIARAPTVTCRAEVGATPRQAPQQKLASVPRLAGMVQRAQNLAAATVIVTGLAVAPALADGVASTSSPHETSAGHAISMPSLAKLPSFAFPDNPPKKEGEEPLAVKARDEVREDRAEASSPVEPTRPKGVTLKVPASSESPLHVEMSVVGMEVRPAADGLIDGTGHFHLFVDDTPYEEGRPIQFDETHLHFGKGQTEADVTLPPGKHVLTLQFANAVHVSYGPELATSVPVEVK